jgi:hypothetical protein
MYGWTIKGGLKVLIQYTNITYTPASSAFPLGLIGGESPGWEKEKPRLPERTGLRLTE